MICPDCNEVLPTIVWATYGCKCLEQAELAGGTDATSIIRTIDGEA